MNSLLICKWAIIYCTIKSKRTTCLVFFIHLLIHYFFIHFETAIIDIKLWILYWSLNPNDPWILIRPFAMKSKSRTRSEFIYRVSKLILLSVSALNPSAIRSIFHTFFVKIRIFQGSHIWANAANCHVYFWRLVKLRNVVLTFIVLIS